MRYTVVWTLRYKVNPNRITVHRYYGLTRSEAEHQMKMCHLHSSNFEYRKDWYSSISCYEEDE